MELNIEKMSIEEKMRAMELLWDDLCRNQADIDSPPWHENVLRARENDLKEGKDKFLDWKQAKKDIWNSIS